MNFSFFQTKDHNFSQSHKSGFLPISTSGVEKILPESRSPTLKKKKSRKPFKIYTSFEFWCFPIGKEENNFYNFRLLSISLFFIKEIQILRKQSRKITAQFLCIFLIQDILQSFLKISLHNDIIWFWATGRTSRQFLRLFLLIFIIEYSFNSQKKEEEYEKNLWQNHQGKNY